MIRKTKRLSTDSDHSVINPARYCSPNSPPQVPPIKKVKARAIEIKIALKIADSLKLGSDFLLIWNIKSITIMAASTVAVISQISEETFIVVGVIVLV